MNVLRLPQKPDPSSDPETMIREFIMGEAATLSEPTAVRYEIVAEALFEFIDTVDVTSRLGPEIATLLNTERQRCGDGVFLRLLGFTSFLRVLPEFLDDPWLPPTGAQRASHRAVIERLLVFLRRRGLVDSAALRDDFGRVRKAIGTARSRDFHWDPRHDVAVASEELITVTVDIPSRVLDPMLADVERRQHESLADAIADRLDPRSDPHPWAHW